MIRQLAGLAFCVACLAAPAFAQDKDVIVVTGQMIESDDEAQDRVVTGSAGGFSSGPPFVSINIQADYVIFTVSIESGTRAIDERNRELERTFTTLGGRVSRDKTITMEVGYPGSSAALETTKAKEAIQEMGDRSRIPIVFKFATKPADSFEAVRARAETFIDGIDVNGRAEIVTGDLQYIGVTEPRRHREELLRKIADDTRLLQSIFGTPGNTPMISLSGLEGRVKTRPSGPLELEMFIPYAINLSSPFAPPPPR